MRLGIDFGTTRIVVAGVDRCNYPFVAFEDADGASHDWFPPVIAARGEERLYGWDAWSVQGDPQYTIIRSIKRVLDDAGPDTIVQIADQRVPMQQLLTEMALAVKLALEKSSMPAADDETLE